MRYRKSARIGGRMSHDWLHFWSGFVADEWGRKPGFLYANSLLMLFGIGGSLCPNLILFSISGMLVGISIAGVEGCCFSRGMDQAFRNERKERNEKVTIPFFPKGTKRNEAKFGSSRSVPSIYIYTHIISRYYFEPHKPKGKCATEIS